MTNSNSTADQWDGRYAVDDYFYGTEPNDFLRASAHRIPFGSVLCVADGEGRNSVYLATLGYNVSSVDISVRGVEKTMRLAMDKNVKVDAQVGDLTIFDLGVNKWNGIVSIFCHLPTTLRSDVHRRVVEALAPGGFLVLEAYTPNQIGRGTGGPQVSDLLMTVDSLREEFGALEIVHIRETEREVVEGAGHTGHAAVVQLIARKAVED